MADQRPDWLDEGVLDALRSIASRANKHGALCPRCLTGRINRDRNKHGFCQTCEDEVEERYKASKRRWWNERRGLVDGDHDDDAT